MISHHLLRCLLAVYVLGALAIQVYTASLRASAGGIFALTILKSSYWFITLLGGIYFSAAIVEEKEEQTLPLLRMTGASPAAILLGKSIPRLTCVLLFLICITPFLFLAVTLGGAIVEVIAQTIIAILIYAAMMSQVGLLAGLMSRNGERAFSKAIILWIFIEFFPSLSWVCSRLCLAWCDFSSLAEANATLLNARNFDQPTGVRVLSWLAVNLNWVSESTQAWVLCQNLSLTSMGFASQSFWTAQMTFHLAVAATLFLTSLLLFEPCTRHALATSNVAPARKRTRAPKRSWSKALAWKSWQYETGGRLWFWIRLKVVPIFVVAVGAAVLWGIDEKISRSNLYPVLMIAGVPLMLGHIAILFGRVFGREVQEKTLSMLLMLPVSRNRIFVESVTGLIPALFAASSTLAVGLVLLWQDSRQPWNDLFELLEEPWSWQVAAMWITAVYAGILFSMRLRYGGMLLSIVGIFIVAPYSIAFATYTIAAYFVGWSGANRFMENVLPMLMITAEIPLCVWLHFRILKSLDRAGATD